MAKPAPAVAPSTESGPESGGTFVSEPVPVLEAQKPEEAPPIGDDSTRATAHYLRLGAIACGAVGLASLLTGTYYWTRARSFSDSATRTAIYDQTTYDDGQHAEKMQWIFYSVGAVVVASGAGLLVYGKWFLAPKPTKVSLVPTATPNGAGLVAVGAF